MHLDDGVTCSWRRECWRPEYSGVGNSSMDSFFNNGYDFPYWGCLPVGGHIIDRQSKKHWLEFIALITAVVGCATAFIAWRNAGAAVVPSSIGAPEPVASYREKLNAKLEADAQRDKNISDANQKADACNQHQHNIAVVDARFGVLMQDNPILMNSLKSCTQQPDDGSRGQCALAVCAISEVLVGSGCPDVARDVISIGTDFQREKKATVEDRCTLMRTSVQGFFES